MTEEIWLDEGYYTLSQKQQVNHCDYGKGVEFRFEHEGKTLAVAIYTARQTECVGQAMLSVHDVTDEYNDGY